MTLTLPSDYRGDGENLLAAEHPEIVARRTQLALAWKATLPTTVDPACVSPVK